VRFLFFGGKGGVGKTTCAAAHAVRACEEGERVLVVSVDPAHSLGDALRTPLATTARAVRVGRSTMHAMELDADAALRRWMGKHDASLRAIAERGTYLDSEAVDRLMGLRLPGTDELVGWLELRRVARAGRWDSVVVDTAPTGHALRLLQTPRALERVAQVLDEMQAKHRLLSGSIAGRYCPDAADETILEIADEAASLRALLADSRQCETRWVLLPEALSVEETADALAELGALGVRVTALIVNRVTPRPSRTCAQCTPRVRAETAAIADARNRFRDYPLTLIAAAEREPSGIAALRALGRPSDGETSEKDRRSRKIGRREFEKEDGKTGRVSALLSTNPSRLPAFLSNSGEGPRLLLFGGKGGVGKTTCAAAAAIALARAKKRVLLLSTDPAHSVSDVLAMPIGDEEREVTGVAGLYARELDAPAAFEAERHRYREAIDAMFRSLVRSPRFDATYDRVVMEDLIDLAPPGIDEVFAIVTLLDALEPRGGRRRRWDVVVVDTAPTGHTLRLLAMPSIARDWTHALLSVLLKYRRVLGLGELASDVLLFARRLGTLQELLHDPARAAFVVVTRPAELPRLETERLLASLARMRIPCPAVVVDAVSAGTCDRCRSAAALEEAQLSALARRARLVRAILVAPAQYPPPRGVASLARWAARWGERSEARSPSRATT
jgi:arsenite-transporting ATPase